MVNKQKNVTIPIEKISNDEDNVDRARDQLSNSKGIAPKLYDLKPDLESNSIPNVIGNPDRSNTVRGKHS